MKKLVIFDFDGTLADTSLGILACHRHTLKEMGRNVPGDAKLRGIIGAPLFRSYVDVFGFAEEAARKAVSIYRARYAEKGIYEVSQYDGMLAVLQRLKAEGILIGIATLKAHRFLSPMLEHLGLSNLIDVYHGMDDRDGLTKASLLAECMSDMKVSTKDTVLVGDSIFDANGAREAGIDFVGVSYGFGFKPGEVLCNRPADILGCIL